MKDWALLLASILLMLADGSDILSFSLGEFLILARLAEAAARTR
jgi:hypothetical protein